MAIFFSLTLFLEVACLPLISTFSLQVEKSMVAELDEKEDNDAENPFEVFNFAHLLDHTLQYDFQAISKPNRELAFVAKALVPSEPAFIQYHSLRI